MAIRFCLAGNLALFEKTDKTTPKTYKAEWDFTKHWMAIVSILLILGAAGVAVPLALRVSSGQYYNVHNVHNRIFFCIYCL